MRIACHTLGCKVNQYDTQAMLECFERAGYMYTPFEEEADVYLVNTCTVTGTGDKKSLQLIRRIHRLHPEAGIIVAGCLAQRDARRVLLPGVRLVVGVRRRGEVVSLYERALAENRPVCAVEQGGTWSFEPLRVSRHEGKTRATLKIQEGCDRCCAYCIIPYVRGPVRSMAPEAVESEARRLAEAGYPEIVLTGIHLGSYGRGTERGLLDAVERVQNIPGVKRIRLGSLEPPTVTEEWVRRLLTLDKVCPQFHLSMQSGSAGVLRRMRRQYDPKGYLKAARLLQNAYEHCAITTDVLTAFPGETEEEALETEAFLGEVGFARIHVFPYSRRAGTLADKMPGQLSQEVKQERTARLIAIGNQLERAFVQKLVGSCQEVLFESETSEGLWEGYTPQYVRVRARGRAGQIARVCLEQARGTLLLGSICEEE